MLIRINFCHTINCPKLYFNYPSVKHKDVKKKIQFVGKSQYSFLCFGLYALIHLDNKLEAEQQAVARLVGAGVGRENQKFKNQRKESARKRMRLGFDKEGEIWSLFFIKATCSFIKNIRACGGICRIFKVF